MSLKALIFGSVLTCSAGAAYAQCTHEPQLPVSRYEVNGAQVFDKETELTWQRCSYGQKWQEGADCVGTPTELTWTEAQRLGGGWRLPTKDEMLRLVSRACLPSVNTEVFPGFSFQHPTYWTSTETAPNLTWTVNMTSGAEFNALQTSRNAVLLVQTQRAARTVR